MSVTLMCLCENIVLTILYMHVTYMGHLKIFTADCLSLQIVTIVFYLCLGHVIHRTKMHIIQYSSRS